MFKNGRVQYVSKFEWNQTSNEQKFRLNKINETKYYFVAEIKEREPMSKRQ